MLQSMSSSMEFQDLCRVFCTSVLRRPFHRWLLNWLWVGGGGGGWLASGHSLRACCKGNIARVMRLRVNSRARDTLEPKVVCCIASSRPAWKPSSTVTESRLHLWELAGNFAGTYRNLRGLAVCWETANFCVRCGNDACPCRCLCRRNGADRVHLYNRANDRGANPCECVLLLLLISNLKCPHIIGRSGGYVVPSADHDTVL